MTKKAPPLVNATLVTSTVSFLKASTALLTAVFMVSFPSSAHAQIVNPVIGELGDNPNAAAQGTTFTEYFIVLWQALISIGGLLVIIYLIWGAIEWITSGGDSSKVQKARDKMTQAVIGMIVLAGTFILIEMISAVFFAGEFNILELEFI